MGSIIRNIVPIGIVLLIVVGIWFAVKNVNVVEIMELDPAAVRAETDKLEADLVQNITALQTLDLNTVLFDLEEYQVLLDKRVSVNDVPTQNSLPFAPLQ